MRISREISPAETRGVDACILRLTTRKPSQCSGEFHCCRFLLVAEYAEEGATCVTSHPSFAPRTGRRVLQTYFIYTRLHFVCVHRFSKQRRVSGGTGE